MSASHRLSDEVRKVLEAATVNGTALRLNGQLDRKLYTEVDKALKMMGGKWSRTAGVHIFDRDAESAVADAIASGAVINLKEAFQFFETPSKVAELLVRIADLRDDHLTLEPSAGRGAIIRAIRKAVGVMPDFCELWDENRAKLYAELGEAVFLGSFVKENFLDVELVPGGVYDRIVANPPFSGGQDATHVLHMFDLLKPGGRLVSVMSPGWKFRSDTKHLEFRHFAEQYGATWVELPPNSFSSSGTGVNTGIIKIDAPL
jgi:hypothetical protein